MKYLKRHIDSLLALALIAGASIFLLGSSVHADISNPHSVPPNNSITNAMLQSGIVIDANVGSGAQVQLSKLGTSNDASDIPYGGSSNIATTSSLQYNSGTNTVKAGTFNATAGGLCNNGTCWTLPSTDGTTGQVIKTNGSLGLSFTTPPSVASTTIYYATGSWTKPAGFQAVSVYCLGSGGAGGDIGGTGGAAGGGGGGGYVSGVFPFAQLPSSVTVTVAGTSTDSSGGPSSFGAFLKATGGTQGTSGINGSTNSAGAAGGAYQGTTVVDSVFGSGIVPAAGVAGNPSVYGGASGAGSIVASNAPAGGSSQFGGGGGGGGSSSGTGGAGGTSTLAGAGGSGATGANNGNAGGFPAGGGGGGAASNGKVGGIGGEGLCSITDF